MGAPAFMSVIVVAMYATDYHIFKKEIANGMYEKSAYVASQFILMVPGCLILSSCSLLPLYMIVGFSWAALPTILIAHFTCMLWAESLAQLLAACSPHFLLGMVAYIGVMFWAFIQGGTVISVGSITWALRWGSYVSPWFLSLRAMITADFNDSL